MYAQNQKSQALALFDFDGTLYPHDSFTGFIFYVLKKRHIIWRGLKILPWITAYYLKLYPAHRMRPKLYSAMFKDVDIEIIQPLALQYANKVLENLDPTLFEQLKIHQQLGHKVILVSATIDLYLEIIAKALNVELICSQVEIKSGKLTGKYLTPDCSCLQKKLRVLEAINLADYEMIYAYGNSEEDEEMLSLAQQTYMAVQDKELPMLDKIKIS
ncbi:HAD family hydrolase [Acinetobacter sp. ASP199]|uniref:HAD family hydrolase n=1 Tax=unclassified Acinetobacter TaxID=196816 RepID=UPI001F626005|nr:HAD family hydrolase [Acinetobacter sp. ASP199]UNT60270.1 haloacid dehalogenase-like hydrolase [Acinetobacter sp. ASP199]